MVSHNLPTSWSIRSGTFIYIYISSLASSQNLQASTHRLPPLSRLSVWNVLLNLCLVNPYCHPDYCSGVASSGKSSLIRRDWARFPSTCFPRAPYPSFVAFVLYQIEPRREILYTSHIFISAKLSSIRLCNNIPFH